MDDGAPTVAVLSDLWPSASEPYSGAFVRVQLDVLGPRFRQLVLVPRLVLPGAHHRVWGRSVQGWQRRYVRPAPPGRLLRYPMLRIPWVGEAEARAAGARLVLAARRERPALVHGHFLYEVGVAAVRLGRSLGVPAVVSVHGTDGRWLVEGGVQERHRRRMLEALQAADRIVVVERGLADRLVEAGAPSERVVVLPMGVDEDVFRPRDRAEARRALELDPERRLVLFVGRPTPAKGIEVLDRALDQLDADCVAVGPRGRARRIRFVGPEPPERVALWLAAADLLCLPSFAEGMPVAVEEALACGRPVVATAVGGLPEQVEEGVTGLLVPTGDAAALAAALREALGREWDPARARAASERFWSSLLAPRLAALYEELL